MSSGWHSERYEDGTWLFIAACRGVDTAVFFPDRDTITPDDITRAKSFCSACEVRAECLETNLSTVSGRDDEGIWGNTTPGERLRLRAARRASRRGGCGAS